MVSKVKDSRPVNLDIGTMRLPITAWASMTHRASGVFLFVAVAVLIWMLDASLRSPESFAALQETLTSVPVKVVLLSLIHISEPTRRRDSSRMPSSA